MKYKLTHANARDLKEKRFGDKGFRFYPYPRISKEVNNLHFEKPILGLKTKIKCQRFQP